jgi:hypothetical protein
MSPDTFEMLAMITLVVSFYVVCMRLGELHSQLRKLERRLLGDSEADLAKLAEIRSLAVSGKQGRAVAAHRRYFGTSLAEATDAVRKLDGDAAARGA